MDTGLGSAMLGLSPKTTVDLLSLLRLLQTQENTEITTLIDFAIGHILLYIDSHCSSTWNYPEC